MLATPKSGAGRGTGREPLENVSVGAELAVIERAGRRLAVGCDELGLAQRQAIGSGDLDLVDDAARRKAGADLIGWQCAGPPPQAASSRTIDDSSADRANHSATVSAKAGAGVARPVTFAAAA